jgi:hypothetical protein
VTDPHDLETAPAAQKTKIDSLRDALNAYHRAVTEEERRVANEHVIATLKQRQWTWEPED